MKIRITPKGKLHKDNNFKSVLHFNPGWLSETLVEDLYEDVILATFNGSSKELSIHVNSGTLAASAVAEFAFHELKNNSIIVKFINNEPYGLINEFTDVKYKHCKQDENGYAITFSFIDLSLIRI